MPRTARLLIDRDSDLLECGRYVELNPVRAGLVRHPQAYPWSSYRVYTEGADNSLADPDPLYTTLGSMPSARQQRYQRFVREGIQQPPPSQFLKHRALGSEAFVTRLEEELGVSLTARPRGHPRITSALAANEK